MVLLTPTKPQQSLVLGKLVFIPEAGNRHAPPDLAVPHPRLRALSLES